MAYTLRFAPPVPERPRHRIQPVFIPYAGCPYRCIFCAQKLQTGTGEEALETRLAALEASLEKAVAEKEDARELAFYGGTFTALSMDEQLRCLKVAARYKKEGLILRVRASTRPDAVRAKNLATLRHHGLDMLELGVQSFDNEVLARSRPGYTGEEAMYACATVRENGLGLGVQLMPGLPGMSAAVFRADIQKTIDARPEALRLYPCLVIEGTPLAELWRQGAYKPWGLNETIMLLAGALIAAERRDIAVIRMGLAPEPGLQPAILAGPEHPALGSRVRGRALHGIVRLKCQKLGRQPRKLCLPHRLRGEFSGHRGELLPLYKELGIDAATLHWHDKPYCELVG